MKVAFDKVLHLLCNFSIVVTVGILDPFVGVAAAAALSFGKEGYDYEVKGAVSIGDLIADGIGIGFGIAVLILMGVVV